MCFEDIPFGGFIYLFIFCGYQVGSTVKKHIKIYSSKYGLVHQYVNLLEEFRKPFMGMYAWAQLCERDRWFEGPFPGIILEK